LENLPDIGDELYHVASSLLENIRDWRFMYILKFLFLIIIINIICILIVVVQATYFSPIVPPSAAGFASVASDAGGLLWGKLERFKSLVLLQVGGLTWRWQRHSVKPSC
jgi:hypothetical protein